MAPKENPSCSPTKSKTITKTVNGSHHYHIKGYSLAKGMGVGKYMSSETFTVSGYKWAIYFYPDGKNAEDNSQYVSLFIALASEGTDVRALFELTMLDLSGRGRHKVHSHFDRALESGPYTLKYRGSMWGYKRFIRRSALEQSEFLKDDSLQITCTVGVVVTETEGAKAPLSIPVPPSQMGSDFGLLLESGENFDVTFDVNGEKVSAHKVILAARSPVLKALLYGPMRDSRTEIPVTDIEPDVFRALIHFIYYDSLPSEKKRCSNFELKLGPESGAGRLSAVKLEERVEEGATGERERERDSDGVGTQRVGMGEGVEEGESVREEGGAGGVVLTHNMAQHLLAAADRYALDRLRLICESKLCESVDSESVAITLALAEQHNAERLKKVCLNFAAQNLASVITSEGFEHLRVSCPSLQAELLQVVAGVNNSSNSAVPTDGAPVLPHALLLANPAAALAAATMGPATGHSAGFAAGPATTGVAAVGAGPLVETVGGVRRPAGPPPTLDISWGVEDVNVDGSDPNGRRVRLRLWKL